MFELQGYSWDLVTRAVSKVTLLIDRLLIPIKVCITVLTTWQTSELLRKVKRLTSLL